jgi:hypothetical protein
LTSFRLPRGGDRTNARQLGEIYVFLFPRGMPWHFLPLALLHLLLLGLAIPACAQNIMLQTATGGFTVSGSHPNFHAGFGNVNGLGLGTPGTGVSVITSGVSGGVLYTTNYNIVVGGTGGQTRAVLNAYVSSNFTHTAVLTLQSCYPSTSCTTAASFTTLSTSSGSPTTIIAQPGVLNGTVTGSLALFVSNLNGGSAFTGTDTATITFNVYAYSSNNNTLTFKEADTLILNTPSENVQTALKFLLATAPSGVAITSASDFALNFGNVNGLGIGPASGLSTSSISGGQLYNTPYLLQPTFSSFSSATGTLKVYVSTNFAHPSQLQLQDSSSSGGAFTAISTSSGSQTTITSTASSGTNVTRYLGLSVSNANGPTIFTGADNATLTYTLVVP